MVDSEGEESRMHTDQSRLVRQSMEATAHPDVYARRKVREPLFDAAAKQAAQDGILEGARLRAEEINRWEAEHYGQPF
jgi:hypothetical protein